MGCCISIKMKSKRVFSKQEINEKEEEIILEFLNNKKSIKDILKYFNQFYENHIDREIVEHIIFRTLQLFNKVCYRLYCM